MTQDSEGNGPQNRSQFSKFLNAASRIGFCALLALGVFLFAGFLRFSIEVANYENPPELQVDGIVVLTGGNSRIKVGLGIISEQRGERLLISGVHKRTSKNTLVARFAAFEEDLLCCVDLDRLAENTAQNATETAKWVSKRGYKSLIVVTSDYHMPRSLLELSRAMPEVLLVPYVARRTENHSTASISDSNHLKIMTREFIKMLATSVRPMN